MKGRHTPLRKFGRSTRNKKAEQLSDEVSNILKKIVIFLLALLVISQLALQFPQARAWLTGVDRLEGTPF